MTKETQQKIESVQENGKKRAVDVKLTQVLATALAAVTAAFLGSRLGVAGTVTGAGVASVVSTLGGAIYQNYLERTSRGVAKVAKVAKVRTARRGEVSASAKAAAAATAVQPQRGRPPLDRTGVAPPWIDTARVDPARVAAANQAEPVTEVMGAWAETRRFEPVRRPDPIADATTDWLSKPTEIVNSAGVFHRPTDVANRPTGVFSRPSNGAPANGPVNDRSANGGLTDDATQSTQPTQDVVGPPTGGLRRRRLLMAGGATALAFVLGMGVVTGIELLADHPFSGGNTGTTIGSLFGGSTQQPTKHSVTLTPTTDNAPAPTTTPSAPPASTSTTAPTTDNAPATTTPSSPTTTQPTTTGAPSTSPVTPTGKVGAP
jgi:hypothetical protein